MEQTGAAGWAIALLCLLGALLAHRRPGIAVAVFAMAALTSLAFESADQAGVFELWAIGHLILASLSSLGWMEQRRLLRRQLVHCRIDEELVPFDGTPPAPNGETHALPTLEPARRSTPGQ